MIGGEALRTIGVDIIAQLACLAAAGSYAFRYFWSKISSQGCVAYCDGDGVGYSIKLDASAYNADG